MFGAARLLSWLRLKQHRAVGFLPHPKPRVTAGVAGLIYAADPTANLQHLSCFGQMGKISMSVTSLVSYLASLAKARSQQYSADLWSLRISTPTSLAIFH